MDLFGAILAIKAHSAELAQAFQLILAGLGAFYGAAVIFVRLTKTQKDDELLAKFHDFLGKLHIKV